MSSDLSPFFGNKICRWLNGVVMPTAPTALYIALFNGNPKTTGVEVGNLVNSGNPRQVVTFAALAAGAAHLLTSNVDVNWGNSANAATFSHVALMDAAAAGNQLASKAVPGGPQGLLVNSSVKFLSGTLTFNIGSDT